MPALSELALAVIVIEPASVPVTVLLATPPAAVAVPRPLTLPVPLVFAKLTEVAGLACHLGSNLGSGSGTETREPDP